MNPPRRDIRRFHLLLLGFGIAGETVYGFCQDDHERVNFMSEEEESERPWRDGADEGFSLRRWAFFSEITAIFGRLAGSPRLC